MSAAHELTEMVLKKMDRIAYRQRRTMEDSYGLPHGVYCGVDSGKISADFELRTSQLIACYRAIIAHYNGDKVRQEQEFMELVNELRREMMPPP